MLDLLKCILPPACFFLLHKKYTVAYLAFKSKETKMNFHIRKKHNSIRQIADHKHLKQLKESCEYFS